MNPTFLTLDEVLLLHQDQLQRYGGRVGIRDIHLVESAIGMPQQTYAGQFVHPTLAEMAAAYLFHLSQNQGFIDGNKRVGVAAAFMFLYLNGKVLQVRPKDLYDVTMAVALGQASKADAAVYIAQHI